MTRRRRTRPLATDVAGVAAAGSKPVIVIANPSAGSGQAVARAGALCSRLRERGHAVRLVVPDRSEATARAARELAPTSAILVASGGDGTANLVMNAALDADVPFSLLASGTGDDNARGLGMPHDPERLGDAIDACLRGGMIVRRVDVAIAQWGGHARAFLGVMSTGLDSTVNERANAWGRLPGTARYIAALAVELRRLRPTEFVIEVDGVELRTNALLASVGNGSSYGGGMRVCPGAAVDDGLLDVTVLEHVPRRTIVRVFPRVFRGTHVRHPAVATLRGTRIRIQSEGALAYADGERLGPLPVRVEIRPKALRVVGGLTA